MGGTRAAGQPRRAGVSSFGFGGVNAHVVLEEGPPPALRTSPARGSAPVHALGQDRRSAADAVERARNRAGDATFAGERGRADLPCRPRVHLAPGRRRWRIGSRWSLPPHPSLRRTCGSGRKATPDVASGLAQAGAHEAMGLFTSEAELEERLRALVAAGELRKLAALWVKGFGIEWERILPRAGAALVTIAGIPVRARALLGDLRQRGALSAAGTRAAGRCTRKVGWSGRSCRDTRRSRRTPEDTQGAVIALVGGPVGRRVAELVGRGRRLLIASLPEGATAEALIAQPAGFPGCST